MIPHWLIIPFLFLFGSCIGSFLNVVVWRLPRNRSLFWPPSACPKCDHRLAWYDNIPVFGWVFLRGKCRYCHEPVSPRYPMIEAITGLLFVAYYAAFFMYGMGPYLVRYDSFGLVEYVNLASLEQDWAVYGLIMFLVCGLLAASLIDAELFIIPIEIPWVIAIVAFMVHALIASPNQVGALSVGPAVGALTVGSGIGLLISYGLLWIRVLPLSFPNGEPMLDVERKAIEEEMKAQGGNEKELAELPPAATKGEIRKQILIESLFLALPVVLGVGAMIAVMRIPSLHEWWAMQLQVHLWLSGLLGSIFGALVAGATIWLTRIIATFVLGRVAMGQGDTHLMVGIGAVLGAGPAVLVFFLAPFAGLVIGIYNWLTRGTREMPYGPYLSLAAGVVIVLFRYVDAYFRQPMEAISQILAGWFS